MDVKKFFKRVSLIAVCGLGISVFSPVSASAETNLLGSLLSPVQKVATKLVDSLKALKLDKIDYLYTYMQSVKLTDSEYNTIVANADKVQAILGKVDSPSKLSTADKAEITNLFLDSANRAHVKVDFVDKNGKAINLTNYNFSNGLKLTIKDLNGKVLATVDPTKNDLKPEVLASYVESFKQAVDAKVELEEVSEGKFVPMPGAKLPDTSTNEPLYIALGALLVVLGAAAVKPAMSAAKKIELKA